MAVLVRNRRAERNTQWDHVDGAASFRYDTARNVLIFGEGAIDISNRTDTLKLLSGIVRGRGTKSIDKGRDHNVYSR